MNQMNKNSFAAGSQADIWTLLLAGGRVRPKHWPEGSYAEFKDGYVCNQYGQRMNHWAFSEPENVVVVRTMSETNTNVMSRECP